MPLQNKMTILSHSGLSQSIYTETTWAELLLLVWRLHQHSHELEKKTLIRQTCHNHLKDMFLRQFFLSDIGRLELLVASKCPFV